MSCYETKIFLMFLLRSKSMKAEKNNMGINGFLDFEGISLWWFLEDSLNHRMEEESEKGVKRSKVDVLKFLSIAFGSYLFLFRSLFRFCIGNLLSRKSNNNGRKKILRCILFGDGILRI